MNITLDYSDFLFLTPLIILACGALLILLIESFLSKKQKNLCFFVAVITFIGALIASSNGWISNNPLLTAWLKTDSLSFIIVQVFLSVGLASCLLAHSFFEKFENNDAEYYFLLIACIFGLCLIGASADFLTLFIGLETLSISLYILCGYVKKWSISHESAIKYFLIGSLGTAFLIYGIALVYGATGTTNFNALSLTQKALTGDYEKALFFGGLSLVTVGFLFKAAIFPFHSWAPDVYEGASTPVTAFMAVGTKIGAFVAIIRLFLEAMPQIGTIWNDALWLLFFPTLIYGNIVALRQTNLRRFFAYSGIVNSGYLLIPLVANRAESISSILFYLVVYALSTFAAFAVLSVLDKEKRGLYMDDLKSLFSRSPFLASILSLSLLTLAGIPPTVGFFAKFYIFKVGFEAGYYAMVIVGLLMTVFSAFYYLRIISKMLESEHSVEGSGDDLKLNLASSIVGVLSVVGIVLFSIFPGLLLDYLSK